ncbi:MAG TPA: O-antigen ligase family protein [Pyrinomonadaceae bacterium]|jgi:O-antigen ligase
MTLKICRWLFLLLIVSLPLVRPFNVVVFRLQVPFTDFIFLVAFVFWVAALWRRETEFRFDRLYLFIGFYALALTVSTIFSIDPQRSFFKLLGEFYLFGLGVLTFNLVRDKSFFRSITIAWLSGTALTVLAALAGFLLFYAGYKTQADNYFLSHFGSLPAGNYPRIHALFANANMMCNFLNVGLMLALLTEKNGWLKTSAARLLQIGVWFAAFFTFSAGLGGMFLSYGIWFRVSFKTTKKFTFAKIALSISIILAALVFASTLVSPSTDNTARDFSIPFSDKKFEPSVRVLVWENALANYREFPILGRGTGSNAASLQYRTLSGDNQLLLDAHNVWLNVLGQAGLPGLLALVLLTLYLFRRCRFRFDELNEANAIHLALSCAFVGAFLYQGLSGSFEDARHLWILFGMLAGIANFSKNDISEASREP